MYYEPRDMEKILKISKTQLYRYESNLGLKIKRINLRQRMRIYSIEDIDNIKHYLNKMNVYTIARILGISDGCIFCWYKKGLIKARKNKMTKLLCLDKQSILKAQRLVSIMSQPTGVKCNSNKYWKIMNDRTRYNGMKEKLIKIYGNKCMRCGSTKQIHLHHKNNKGSMLPKTKRDNSLKNLELLCNSCHGKEKKGSKNDRNLCLL